MLRPRMSCLSPCLRACTFVLFLLASALPHAAARPGPSLQPPVLKGVVLDGVPHEAEWKGAARIPVPAVVVPTPGAPKPVSITPIVHIAVSEGRLVVGVEMPEDPGTALGLHLMIAPAGAKSAADAISLDVRPVELRAPRFRTLGPKGVGRTHYRIEGAADITQAGRWTLEAGLPLADLVGEAVDQALRVALVVYTRTPNVLTVWPQGATWKSPAFWNELLPPAGGWPLDAQVDTVRFAKEDAADAECAKAWLAYLQGASTPVPPVKPREELLATIHAKLIDPLHRLRALRPDLGPPVDCLLGDIAYRLGDIGEAVDRYDAALSVAPGWREAGYGLFVKVRGSAAAEGPPGGPTSWARFEANLATAFDEQEFPASAHYARDGRRLAAALIAYKRGRFDEAAPALTVLSKRYPFDAFIDAHRRLAERGRRAAGEEALRVKVDAGKKLPRATLETTAGTIVLELLHDDARNTVFNFVWLAKHGFYDDCTVHRTVPGFVAQTGDPFTRTKSSRPTLVGSGTPGYAIRTELGKRWPLRGYVALANGGPNSDGSQFMLFTGSALHRFGEVTVFARVVEGMDVLDRLHAGADADRITSVRVAGLDPERTYHPSTGSGNRAPPPKLPVIKAAPPKKGN